MGDSHRREGLAAAIGTALLLLAGPAGAEHHVRLHWSADLGVGYDDNVGNAAMGGDARDSGVISGGVNLDYVRALSLNTALLLRGGLQGDGYEAEDGLSNVRLLAMTRLSHRPTGGFYMPTFAGWISAGVLEFDSTMRDGLEFRGGLFVTEPLTTTIAARLSFAASERRSGSSVFDLSGWSAGLNLDWVVAPRFTLYGGYQFQDGDVVSTGTLPPKSSHLPGGCGSATACDPDDALDGQFAYRVDAQTHIGTFGLNVPLSGRLAVDAQARRIDSTADGGTRYARWQGVVSVLLRL
jgi:hypothetical protein